VSAKPFDIMQWDAPEAPTKDKLVGLLEREGLKLSEESLSPGKTPEMKNTKVTVYVLISGSVYVGLPGYGSVDLDPGDILEINPDVTHDLVVTGQGQAILLKALR